MKGLKSHFDFNKSQRNGIFLLVLIIIALQVGYFFVDFSSEEDVMPEQRQEIIQFERQMDSLKRVAAAKDSTPTFSFNPNFISDYKGYTLGLSVEEIDRLHAYRAQDKWINSEEDFRQVTRVSDSLLKQIAPLFRFPEWVQNSRIESSEKEVKSLSMIKRNLNEATAEDLRVINGIGEVLSQRIINYREKLGGFNHEIQLIDVYGLKPEVAGRVKDAFFVPNPVVEKADINTISLMELSELPYFNYELARLVVKYRDSNNGIRSFDDLTELKGFPSDKIERIKLYLTIQ